MPQVIAAYRDTGLAEPVWAAAVPKSYTKQLAGLVEEVHNDHAEMVRDDGLVSC